MTGWADLEQELDLWRQQGLTLSLWWRTPTRSACWSDNPCA